MDKYNFLTVLGVAIAILAIVVRIVLFIIQIYSKKKKKRKGFFRVDGKKSSDLIPYDVMSIRAQKDHGFEEYYYEREYDKQIEQMIIDGQSVIITGEPLAGKSRAVYQTLKRLNPVHYVYIPHIDDFNIEEFQYPPAISAVTRNILLLDDIDKYTAKRNFPYLLSEYAQRDFIIVATCRSGPEYKYFCDNVEQERLIFDKPIKIEKIPRNEAEKIANDTQRELPARFNGNIGSIFVRLDAMTDCYAKCTDEERTVLLAIKRLYNAGIYEENEVFAKNRVSRICQKIDGMDRKKYEMNSIFESLAFKSFISIKNGNLQIEETYLKNIIDGKFDKPSHFETILDVFSDDSDALFLAEDRVFDFSQISVQKSRYAKIAIKLCLRCLELEGESGSVEHVAKIQNNLGKAYWTLADVEDKPGNCTLAIKACKEALKIRTLDDFPMDYAMTQNNLGNAYSTLAEVQDKPGNCTLAIKACKEALKIRTLDDFPIDYAMMQNNLGDTYRMLAEVEDKPGNCTLAIKACKEALHIYTLDDFPMDYAMTQNNLGTAYGTLAEVEDKPGNCALAIDACKEALNIYTLDDFPMDYAMTQNNLGNAYKTLAEVEDKPGNCNLAIIAYKEALNIYTIDDFPYQYAMTQNNLGNAYSTLAEVEDKPGNCRLAIKAFKEALKIYTLDVFPMDYAMTQNNLGTAYRTLADVEDKPGNCQRARQAFENALKVYTDKAFPLQYAGTIKNLGILDSICGEEK
ncbi:MAG: tetratricopeptide repeat protein [candidate division Zixibacteria bacterium]